MKISTRSILLWVVFAPLAVGLFLTTAIACRHFRSSSATFERGPVDPSLAQPASTGVAGLQAISFVSADGVRISAWYRPPSNGAVIVLVHGTDADRRSLASELRFLSARGFGVLAYDGPGYGLSTGSARWAADAETAVISAVDWLEKRPTSQAIRIGGLGLSMGGYALVHAASTDPRIQALVLEAVPPDFIETTQWQHRKWGVISRWPALWALQASPELLARPPSEALVPLIAPRPVLFVTGDQDQTVPEFMTKRMYDRAGSPKELLVVAEAGHGRYSEVSPVVYPTRIIDFFSRTLLPSGGTQPPPLEAR